MASNPNKASTEEEILKALYIRKSSSSLSATWPVAIIQDRYSGTYSGGAWLAIANSTNTLKVKDQPTTRVDFCFSDGPHGGDPQAMEFWTHNPDWIASGVTPDHALEQLNRKFIKPLPELKVVRDIYCSQQMTDQLLRALYENRIDLVGRMIDGLKKSFRQTDMDIIHILSCLQKELPKTFKTPSTRLGWMDLMFELTRRVRNLSGMSDIQPIGIPLIEEPVQLSPQEPSVFTGLQRLQQKMGLGKHIVTSTKGIVLPPIPKIQISKEGGGITQAIAEKAFELVYKRRPDILYELSESIRRDMNFFTINHEFLRFLDSISNELSDPVSKPPGRWQNQLLEEVYSHLALSMKITPLESRTHGHYMLLGDD